MIIAVDTGGTKTLIAGYNTADDKSILAKFPTPRDQSDYLSQVADIINKARESSEIEAIVVAIPGPIRDGIVQRTPNIGWQQFDVVGELSKLIPNCPIKLGNDADLAGLSEARALENPKLSVYITLSTGVGAGITYQGHLIPGIERFESGSIRIEYGGERQRWEHVASGKSFYERYGQFGSDVTDPEKWQDYAERVASGLMVVIPLLEPNHIIIGGSMGTHFLKYHGFLTDILNNQIAKHMPNVQIVQAKYPEEAVIYGCYYYARDLLDNQ